MAEIGLVSNKLFNIDKMQQKFLEISMFESTNY